jgi:hypothetical protein
MRRAAAASALVLLAALAAPPAVRAETAAGQEPPPTPRRPTTEPRDAMSSLGGSTTAWSVSSTDLGCLLLSPVRKTGIRMALGRHATYGAGLFFIGFELAVKRDEPPEPVALSAGGRTLAESGRQVARNVLFVPLSDDDLAMAMRELQNAGTLWVTVLQTSMADGGDGAKEAVDAYARQCAAPRPAATPH